MNTYPLPTRPIVTVGHKVQLSSKDTGVRNALPDTGSHALLSRWLFLKLCPASGPGRRMLRIRASRPAKPDATNHLKHGGPQQQQHPAAVTTPVPYIPPTLRVDELREAVAELAQAPKPLAAASNAVALAAQALVPGTSAAAVAAAAAARPHKAAGRGPSGDPAAQAAQVAGASVAEAASAAAATGRKAAGTGSSKRPPRVLRDGQLSMVVFGWDEKVQWAVRVGSFIRAMRAVLGDRSMQCRWGQGGRNAGTRFVRPALVRCLIVSYHARPISTRCPGGAVPLWNARRASTALHTNASFRIPKQAKSEFASAVLGMGQAWHVYVR